MFWIGMVWDAFENEIANGVYIYRLKAINGNSVVSYIGRCAKYKMSKPASNILASASPRRKIYLTK